MENTFYVSLEGSIGSGKTSFMNYFKSFQKKCLAIDEPVKQFSSYKGLDHNPLLSAYHYPLHDAGLTQLHIIEKCANYYNLNKWFKDGNHKYKIAVSERSVLSPEIFTNAHYSEGNLTRFGKQYVLDYFHHRLDNVKIPDAFIFLNVLPSTCMDRLQLAKKKNGENLIKLPFLESLYMAHKQFFDVKKYTEKIPVEIVILNKDMSKIEAYAEIDKALKKLVDEWQAKVEKNAIGVEWELPNH